MIHIHPFPARMAPEIALEGLRDIPKNYKILDPMSGSGMVLGTASKLGLKATGIDLDPLACLISKTNGTIVDQKKAAEFCKELIRKSSLLKGGDVYLPWVDNDPETQKYIDFWFAAKQIEQLRKISYLLLVDPISDDKKIINLLKVAVSRLIITKEPKASLARDTAHSRPHRTIKDNQFDVLASLEASFCHVLKALSVDKIKKDVSVYHGDARDLVKIRDSSIDCIITSPPYLNAIDYMRGHRLSLVWLGYSIEKLRNLRSVSVGSETKILDQVDVVNCFSKEFVELENHKRLILNRYCRDLCSVLSEAYRVLKADRLATYVMGNSVIKGFEVENSELLIAAGENAGFEVFERSRRQIPEGRRYMPLVNSKDGALSKRMREEHVITFRKVA